MDVMTFRGHFGRVLVPPIATTRYVVTVVEPTEDTLAAQSETKSWWPGWDSNPQDPRPERGTYARFRHRAVWCPRWELNPQNPASKAGTYANSVTRTYRYQRT